MKRSSIAAKTTAGITALLFFLGTPGAGAGASEQVPAIRVYETNNNGAAGAEYSGGVMLVKSTTYVGLREFSDKQPRTKVSWNEKTKTAKVDLGDGGVALIAVEGKDYVTAGKRTFPCPAGVFIKDGKTYVPLRAIASAFGYRTEWNSNDFSASIIKETTPSAAENSGTPYSSSDLYWLSRIICAEAKGESFAGKLAVGTVVMNRVRSDKFPNTIYGVVFDTVGGVQFTPVSNGSIYSSPDEDSIAAAKLCLEGNSGMSKDILFFLNAKKSNSFWIPNNRRYVTTIGGHDFYA